MKYREQMQQFYELMFWANSVDADGIACQSSVYGHCRNAINELALKATGIDISHEDILHGEPTWLEIALDSAIESAADLVVDEFRRGLYDLDEDECDEAESLPDDERNAFYNRRDALHQKWTLHCNQFVRNNISDIQAIAKRDLEKMRQVGRDFFATTRQADYGSFVRSHEGEVGKRLARSATSFSD